MVQENSIKKPKVIIVVGPTASGKTAVGVKLAKSLNGEIISADSMQIYKKMDIGTAKVTSEEMGGIVHHLIDIVNPTESYSVAEWVKDASAKIDEIIARGKTPIIVGGTGLYVTSLIKGYTFYDVPENIELRETYRKILEDQGIDALYQILIDKNPDKASMIDKNKTKAVIRALELIDGGADLSNDENAEPYDYVLFGLDHAREILYDRINKRVDIMFDQGLEQEFNMLTAEYGLKPIHQSAGAIGYKEMFAYQSGECGLEETKDLIKQHSRNYAKRQLTWFRRMDNILWLSPVKEYDKIEQLSKKFMGE